MAATKGSHSISISWNTANVKALSNSDAANMDCSSTVRYNQLLSTARMQIKVLIDSSTATGNTGQIDRLCVEGDGLFLACHFFLKMKRTTGGEGPPDRSYL